MALYITRRPEKLLAGTTYSRWTALHNPYIFEFTRKDYPVVSTAIRPSYHATLPTAKVTGETNLFVTAGDTIYLNSGIYNGTYTVISATQISTTESYIVIDTPYIGVGGSGYVNYSEVLVNYKSYIIIYDAADNSVIDILYPKPDSTGLLLCDVSGAIKSTLETADTCGFTLINQKNAGMSGSFYLGYGVTYKFGSTQITTVETVDATTYYWINAAKQVTGQTVLGMGGYGQNMAEYVPFNMTGSAAKFLTMFNTPTKFTGYPFTLGFIYSEDFQTTYLERHQINYNINRQATSAESDQTLLVSEMFYANDLQIADEDATTTEMDVWLETGSTIADGYVESGGIQLGSASAHAAPYISTSGG